MLVDRLDVRVSGEAEAQDLVQNFMKQLNGDKLTYLPEDYYSTGWVEAKFVEG